MRFLLTSALKDLRWRARDPVAISFWVGVPLLVGSLLSLIGGDGGPRPKARLLIADLDRSPLSSLLSQSRDWGGVLETETVGADEGRARIDAGEASELLVLPAGFGDRVLNDEQVRLTLLTNPAQLILPRIVEEALDLLLEAGFYIQRLAGDPIRGALAGRSPADLSNAEIAALLVEARNRFQRASSLLAPPALVLEVETAQAQPNPGFGMLFLPGVLFMALVFTAQGTSDDLWREKEQGTLRRLAISPQPVALFLGGKLLAGSALMALVSLSGLAMGIVRFDLPLERIPLALAWCTVAGSALLSPFMLLQLLSSSRRGGNLLAIVFVFPMIMIGGSFFPFELMPPWMAELGRRTPNGMAVARMKELLAGRADAATLLTGLLALAALAGAGFALSLGRLRRFVTK